MIEAFAGVIAMLLSALSVVARPATAMDPPEGTSSTPSALTLPQLGSVGFWCGRSWTVQPFFNVGQAVATEQVTIRARSLTRRNLTRTVVGRTHGRPITRVEVAPIRWLALPFAHYRSAAVTVDKAPRRARSPRSWVSSSSPERFAPRPTQRISSAAMPTVGSCASTSAPIRDQMRDIRLVPVGLCVRVIADALGEPGSGHRRPE
jgi:hypothetical protein